MEFPKCCAKCKFQAFSDLNGESYCIFTGQEILYLESDDVDIRPDNCPLIYVPKKESNYSDDPIKNEIMDLMNYFLRNHDIWELLEIVVGAAATKEQQ